MFVNEFTRVPDSFFVSYWDLGGSDNIDSDRTTNWLLHKTPGQMYTFVESTGFRLRKSERNRRIYNTEKNYRDKYGEMGQIFSRVEWQMGSAVEVTAEIIRECGEFAMRDDHVTRKLTERAEPLQVQMQSGNVRFLKQACTPEILDEFMSFDQGKHDDYISAAAGAYNCAAVIRML